MLGTRSYCWWAILHQTHIQIYVEDFWHHEVASLEYVSTVYALRFFYPPHFCHAYLVLRCFCLCGAVVTVGFFEVKGRMGHWVSVALIFPLFNQLRLWEKKAVCSYFVFSRQIGEVYNVATLITKTAFWLSTLSRKVFGFDSSLVQLSYAVLRYLNHACYLAIVLSWPLCIRLWSCLRIARNSIS